MFALKQTVMTQKTTHDPELSEMIEPTACFKSYGFKKESSKKAEKFSTASKAREALNKNQFTPSMANEATLRMIRITHLSAPQAKESVKMT